MDFFKQEVSLDPKRNRKKETVLRREKGKREEETDGPKEKQRDEGLGSSEDNENGLTLEASSPGRGGESR